MASVLTALSLTNSLHVRWYIYSVKRDLNSVKRDLNSVKRDLNSVKRDLNSVKRDLNSVKRDLYSVKRDLNSVKRDLLLQLGSLLCASRVAPCMCSNISPIYMKTHDTHTRYINILYVCMHACMHACMYACMYVCMYVCTYTYLACAVQEVRARD